VRRNYIHWKAAKLEIFVGNMDAYAYWDILETELQNNSKKRLFLTKK